LYRQNAERFIPEYDWRYIKAQSWQESRFDPLAVSPVGAAGLMQIMPKTGLELARQTGAAGPLTSPALNALYGAFYMRRMLNIWHSPRPPLARLELAWASYNAGAGHILKAQKLANGAPLWDDISPQLVNVTGKHSRETLTYVSRIHRWYGDLACCSDP